MDDRNMPVAADAAVFAPDFLHPYRLRRTADAGLLAYSLTDRHGVVLSVTPEGMADHVANAIRSNLDIVVAESYSPAARRHFREQFRRLDRQYGLRLLRRVFQSLPPLLTMILSPLPAGDSADESRLRMVYEDGQLSVVVDDYLELPVLGNGELLGLNHGWRPGAVVTSFWPFLMLELEHEAGDRAIWVVDEALRRVDDDHLRHEGVRARIQAVAPMLIRRMMYRIFNLEDATPDPATDMFLRLNRAMLFKISRLCLGAIMPAMQSVAIGELADGPTLRLRATGGTVTLGLGALRATVEHDLFMQGIQLLKGGSFIWPSPIDGSASHLEAVLLPHEGAIFYHFRDRHGLDFLVLAADRHCHTIGVIFPHDALCVGAQHPPDLWYLGNLGGRIWDVLIDFVLRHHELMPLRFKSSNMPPINILMTVPLMHLGHQVWNDLSGIEAVGHHVRQDLLETVVVASTRSEGELVGPLEQIFPKLAGRVDRSIDRHADMIARLLGRRAIPIRFTHHFVSAQLRRSVADYVAALPATGAVDRQARAASGPVIIIGLRPEDRTFVDQVSFYADLLEHLDANHPGATLVFDGRNQKRGGAAGETIAAMTDHLVVRSPLAAEHELFETLKARFRHSSLRFVSTIGESVETSLAWAYRADCCIALWGAGLAKYRWLANLPTLIFSSRFNIVAREDFDIYHSPRWMETPSPVVVPDPGYVTDHIGTVALADSGSRIGRECFEVDRTHATELVDRLMRHVVDRRLRDVAV